MGMYTEIVVKIEINKVNVGEQAFSILEAMFNPNSCIDLDELELPNHSFFRCDRWQLIGNSSSFYHHPHVVGDWYYPRYETLSNDTDIYIFSRSDLKNYNSEIEQFFDWLDCLMLNNSNGDFIGYSLYEEETTPTIFRYRDA